jgi:predicted site-specific integrase-resolvase
MMLYTVKNLAELFQRGEETIRRWIAEGTVFPHAFKVKDGWYVPASDVRRLMKAGRINANSPTQDAKPVPKPPHHG